MKKIPTLFQRDPIERRHVTREVTPGCEWVLAGEGAATRKLDGSCCLVRSGKLFKRYEVKAGKSAPPDFEAADAVDANTGKQPGWVPVGSGPDDQYHREAWENLTRAGVECALDGTYELVGPKIQGNPEGFPHNALIRHETIEREQHINRSSVTYDELAKLMADLPWEGIVWHHPDGRMAKLKRRDFA